MHIQVFVWGIFFLFYWCKCNNWYIRTLPAEKPFPQIVYNDTSNISCWTQCPYFFLKHDLHVILITFNDIFILLSPSQETVLSSLLVPSLSLPYLISNQILTSILKHLSKLLLCYFHDHSHISSLNFLSLGLLQYYYPVYSITS